MLTTIVRSEIRRAWLGRSTLYFLLFGLFMTAVSVGGTFAGLTDLLKAPDGNSQLSITLIRAWFAMSLFIGMATAFEAAREINSGIASRVITTVGGRTRYFLSKATGGTLVGFAGASVAAIASVTFAAVILKANGSSLHMTQEAWLIILGCVVVNTTAGLWGTFIGLLVRNAIAAIVVVLALCMFVEPALQSFLPSLGKYFMTNAMASIYIDAQKNLLPVPWASLIIFSWLVVLGLGAHQLTKVKDLR